jgi:hypothetical protein
VIRLSVACRRCRPCASAASFWGPRPLPHPRWQDRARSRRPAMGSLIGADLRPPACSRP